MLDISLVQVLDAHYNGQIQDVHVAIPGTIVAWDSTKQTATVQPMVRKPLTSADNVLVYETPPQIPNVPVMCMRGGGYFISVPLNEGDGVLLVFSEQSYSEWRSTGQISSPKDVRRHGTGYPYAIPGIAPDSGALASVSSDKLVIGRDGQAELITIGAGQLDIGASPTYHAGLGEPNDNNWTALKTLATAISAYATAIQAVADPTNAATPTLTAAITAFETAVASTAAALAKIK